MCYIISGSAGDRVVNSLQSQFHWQTLTRWENYCQLIIIHIYIHIIFHRPGLPWKDRVFRRCYPLISMYEFIAIELAIWTQTYETLNSPQDMLSEISLLIRFQVSTIMKLSAPLGNWSKHQNSTPLVQVILWEYSEQILYLLPYSISVTLTTSSTFSMFKWIWASHPTWQSCRCHQFFPKPASSAEERWLSISIASLLYNDQGCDNMMAVVGWVAGRVEWCSGDVGNLICCYFLWILQCLQILCWNSWIHESSKLILIIPWIWL